MASVVLSQRPAKTFFPLREFFPCCSINDHFNILFCLSYISNICVCAIFMVSYLVSFCIKCMLSAWGNAFPFSFFVIIKNSFNLLKHFWVVDMAWYGIKTSLLHSKHSYTLCLPSDNISNKKPNTSRTKGILALLGPVWPCIMKTGKINDIPVWLRERERNIIKLFLLALLQGRKPVCVFSGEALFILWSGTWQQGFLRLLLVSAWLHQVTPAERTTPL